MIKEKHLFDRKFLGRRLSFSILKSSTRFNSSYYKMKKNGGYGLITGNLIIFRYGIYFSWYIKH